MGQPQQDQEGGLYNYGARFYNPKWGRFVSPDEMVQSFDSHGSNWFTYVLNRPTSATDPTGNFGDAGFGGGLGGGGIGGYGSLSGGGAVVASGGTAVGFPSPTNSAGADGLFHFALDFVQWDFSNFQPLLAFISGAPTTTPKWDPDGGADAIKEFWDWLIECSCKPNQPGGSGRSASKAAKTNRPDVVRSGGRRGEKVVGIKGPPNSVIRGNPTRGGGNRAFETDGSGRVVREVTRDRVKVRINDP